MTVRARGKRSASTSDAGTSSATERGPASRRSLWHKTTPDSAENASIVVGTNGASALRMRSSWFSLVAVLLVLSACSSDAGSGGADSADGSTADKCCPIDAPPCGCGHVGGSPGADGRCLELCDGHPVGATITKDSNGCDVWHPGPGSCFERDTGVPSTDTAIDTGDASEAGDGGSGVDAADADAPDAGDTANDAAG